MNVEPCPRRPRPAPRRRGGGDVLDDREAEAGAAGRRGAGPGRRGRSARRCARARSAGMPMPWSVTVSSTMRRRCARIADDDARVPRGSRRPRCRPGCRAPTPAASRLPRTSGPRSPSCTTVDLLVGCVDADSGRSRGATIASTSTAPASSSGSSPCSRDSSMICWTSRVSRALSVCIRPANRCTASGSSAASCTASASRLSAPTGVFSSWLHVGDEVAADRLDPALAGAVLDQRQHQPAAQRRAPGR